MVCGVLSISNGDQTYRIHGHGSARTDQSPARIHTDTQIQSNRRVMDKIHTYGTQIQMTKSKNRQTNKWVNVR